MLNHLSPSLLVIFFVSILFAMTIHEGVHGFVAYWLGDTTAKEHGRLTFNPLKSIDLITTILLPLVLVLFGALPFFAARPVPIDPRNLKYREYGAALVGIAGPISNLLLAILASLIFRFLINTPSLFIQEAFFLFILTNVGLFIFNMIPFPPLDGSRLLYAFAPDGLREVMDRIESFGFISILIFVFLIFQFIATPFYNLENHILNFILNLN